MKSKLITILSLQSLRKSYLNISQVETESQQLVMNVRWPLRTFNLNALYQLQDTSLDGKAVLQWNVKDENKTAELRGKWDNPPAVDGNVHNIDLALSHPSFKKVSVTLTMSLFLSLSISFSPSQFLLVH